MRAHFRHLRFNTFSNDINKFSIWWVFTPTIALWKFESPLGFQLPKWEFTWSVRVHSLTLFCILGSTRCDSWASFLTRKLASPCFGCKPKAKVAIFSHLQSHHFKGSKMNKRSKMNSCQNLFISPITDDNIPHFYPFFHEIIIMFTKQWVLHFMVHCHGHEKNNWWRRNWI
jgi:hypothetical protein